MAGDKSGTWPGAGGRRERVGEDGDDGVESWATWMAARNGTGGRTEGEGERCRCLALLDIVAPSSTPGLGTTSCAQATLVGSLYSQPAHALTQCSGERPRMVGGVLCVWRFDIVSIVALSSSPASYGPPRRSTLQPCGSKPRGKTRTQSKPPSSHLKGPCPRRRRRRQRAQRGIVDRTQ